MMTSRGGWVDLCVAKVCPTSAPTLFFFFFFLSSHPRRFIPTREASAPWFLFLLLAFLLGRFLLYFMRVRYKGGWDFSGWVKIMVGKRTRHLDHGRQMGRNGSGIRGRAFLPRRRV